MEIGLKIFLSMEVLGVLTLPSSTFRQCLKVLVDICLVFKYIFFLKVWNRTIDKILFWKWQASPFCNRYSKVVVFLFLLLLLLLLFLFFFFSFLSFLPHLLLPSSSSSSFFFSVFVLNGYLIFFAICYIYIFENSNSLAWLKAGMLLMETPGILLWLFFHLECGYCFLVSMTTSQLFSSQ